MPVKSADKGKRAERELCKILSARFGKPFERTVASGARWAQVKEMTKAAKDTLSGDISVPDGFRWVLESKCGYEDKIDLGGLTSNSTLDSFLAQVQADAIRSGRKPMLLYKRRLRPWLAVVPRSTFLLDADVSHSLTYKDFVVLPLASLLELPDEFWFHGTNINPCEEY